jgi:transcription elongation GreA/GreB family factor
MRRPSIQLALSDSTKHRPANGGWHDLVTKNSRVRVEDLDSGHAHAYQIVFPRDADLAKNPISV